MPRLASLAATSSMASSAPIGSQRLQLAVQRADDADGALAGLLSARMRTVKGEGSSTT